jgi:hypothetical protein
MHHTDPALVQLVTREWLERRAGEASDDRLARERRAAKRRRPLRRPLGESAAVGRAEGPLPAA